MKALSCVIVLGIMFGVIANGSAATLYVARGGQTSVPPYGSWGTAANDIQTAVTKASAGDTVLVSNGVYTLDAQITVDKGVTPRSYKNGDLDRDG